MSVAKTILEQLGGNRFITMTGASNFMGAANSLLFTIPKAMRGINRVTITLDPSDTYTVVFGKSRRVNGLPVFTEISKHSDVYNDSLEELFTAQTGLYTRL